MGEGKRFKSGRQLKEERGGEGQMRRIRQGRPRERGCWKIANRAWSITQWVDSVR